MKLTVSFRSKRLGCNSSAFSPPASRSSFLARHSAWLRKVADLSEGAGREHGRNRARQTRRSHGQDPRAREPGRWQPRHRRRRCENLSRSICHARFRKKYLAGCRANARARLRNIALKAPKPRERSQPQPTAMSSYFVATRRAKLTRRGTKAMRKETAFLPRPTAAGFLCLLSLDASL